MFCKEKIFALIKLVLLEKKIIVYSHVSNNVCSFILSLISYNFASWPWHDVHGPGTGSNNQYDDMSADKKYF